MELCVLCDFVVQIFFKVSISSFREFLSVVGENNRIKKTTRTFARKGRTGKGGAKSLGLYKEKLPNFLKLNFLLLILLDRAGLERKSKTIRYFNFRRC